MGIFICIKLRKEIEYLLMEVEVKFFSKKKALGPDAIDHFAIFALAQNEVTMKYVFWGEKAWSSSALLLISTS